MVVETRHIDDYNVHFHYNNINDFKDERIDFGNLNIFSYRRVYENYLSHENSLYQISKNNLIIINKSESIIVNDGDFKICYPPTHYNKSFTIIGDNNDFFLANIHAHYIDHYSETIYVIIENDDDILFFYNFETYDFYGKLKHKQYIIRHEPIELDFSMSFNKKEKLFTIQILDLDRKENVKFISFDLNGNIVNGHDYYILFKQQYDNNMKLLLNEE